jgi:peptidyl-prolyl cis-trans isomerase D
MLDTIRKGQRWLTAVIVVGVGAVFAIYMGAGSPRRARSPNAVVQAGRYQVGIGEFERTRAQQEEQYRQMLGDQFDARALRDSLDMSTARLLVERAILALEAEHLGLTVTKQEVEREILSSAGFRGPDGRFDKQAFDRWVAYEFGSERAFREQQSRAALAGKLLRVIRAQAYVSEGEARQAVERGLESMRIAFTVLDTNRIPQDFARDEQAIEAFLAEREADARKLYEERSHLYDVPEQIRARHILLRRARADPGSAHPAARGAGCDGRGGRRGGGARPRGARAPAGRRGVRRGRPGDERGPGLQGKRRRPRLLPARPDGDSLR